MREGVDGNQHALIWVTTTAQVADMETKVLVRILLGPFNELIFAKTLSRSENSGEVLRYSCSIVEFSNATCDRCNRCSICDKCKTCDQCDTM